MKAPVDLAALRVTVDPAGVRFGVRAKPRAARSAVVGVRDGDLEVAIAAPPVAGAANEELVRVLARAAGVPRGRVAVLRGEGARTKLVAIAGLSDAELRRALGAEGS